MSTSDRLPQAFPRREHLGIAHWSQHVIVWMAQHRLPLLLAAAGVIAAIAIVAGIVEYRAHRAAMGARALYEAGLPADQPPDELAAKLARVARDYADTPSAALARWERGRVLANAGRSAEALAAFREIADTARDPLLGVAAAVQVGLLQRAAGDFASSADTFARAAARPDNLIADETRYQQALSLEGLKQFSAARAIYAALAAEAKERRPAVAARSEERMRWLDSTHK